MGWGHSGATQYIVFLRLLEGNEARAVRAPDTRTPVTHWLVRDRKLTKVKTDHFWLDLNAIEDLAIVDANDGADHLRHDNHVAQVCLDGFRLVHGTTILLGLAQACDEALRLGFQPAVDASPGASVDQLGELLVVKVQQLFEFDASECKLTKGTLLAQGGGTFHLGLVHSCLRVHRSKHYEKILCGTRSKMGRRAWQRWRRASKLRHTRQRCGLGSLDEPRLSLSFPYLYTRVQPLSARALRAATSGRTRAMRGSKDAGCDARDKVGDLDGRVGETNVEG